MASKTKGQIEAQISEALIQFEKEYMGRGPEETQTHIIEDLVVVRLKRVLTPAEQQLAKSTKDTRGLTLVKQVRTELIEKARTLLNSVISDITGRKVISIHTDISTVTGERIIVFTLNGSLITTE
ncbi:MAG: DUF2294 domain-containing protein [Phycisphaerae bacterium]